MATKKDVLGLIDAGGEIRRPPLVGMQFLHEGAVSAGDVLRGRAGLNAKDLISFLFSHFAAARPTAEWLEPSARLEQDDLSSNRHPALVYCLSMIFSENRFPLFRIML